MKKNVCIIFVLSLLLCLVACGGGGESGAQTGNDIKSNHIHCVCAGKAVGVGAHTACSDSDGWVEISTAQELTDAIAASSAEKPAFVVLTADITVDAYMQVAETEAVNICLNGRKLSASTNVVGKMNITDCAGTGSVVGDKSFTLRVFAGSAVSIYDGTVTTTGSVTDTQIVVLDGNANEGFQLSESEATFTLYNGKIQAVGKTTKVGHCVYISTRGQLKMYGGTICDGYVETTENSARYGGNIAVWGSNSAFHMYGGEVKNGTAVQPQATNAKGGCGGNIMVYRGDLCVYGGTISGGRANGYGGNIGTNNKPGVMEFKDCVIKDGVTEGNNGGNIYINSANEKPVSFENTTISGGKAVGNGGNVFINAASIVSFRDCTVTGGKSTYGAGITAQGKGFIIELKGNMKFSDNESSDIYMLDYKGDQSWLAVAELTGVAPIVVLCEVNMTFTEDTVANHPFVPVGGSLSEVDGKLVFTVE